MSYPSSMAMLLATEAEAARMDEGGSDARDLAN